MSKLFNLFKQPEAALVAAPVTPAVQHQDSPALLDALSEMRRLLKEIERRQVRIETRLCAMSEANGTIGSIRSTNKGGTVR